MHAERAGCVNALTPRHTDAVKTLRRARDTNSLAAAVGISVVATVLALLASVYWVDAAKGWHWSLAIPASFVLSMGPLNWWLRKHRNASRSQ